MKFATVCSGIGAPELAWSRLGWEPQWFSEIEPFPSAVLAHHYPNVPNLGDMTKIHEHEIFKKSIGTIDLICGGTPCQSFSIAGLRKGMDDPRGNLTLQYLRIIDELRPRWVVWENVPGVLSSNGGRDFGSFVGGLGQLGYGWAYRIIDAQYVRVDGYPYAVSQRRRRVFLVGHIGGWQRAAAVLFERGSLSGNPAPCRKKRKGVAGAFEIGPNKASESEVNPTLDRNSKNGPMQNQVSSIIMSTGQANAEITEEHSSTLNCNHEAPIEIPINSIVINTANTGANGSNINTNGVSFTLDMANSLAVFPNREGVRRITPVEAERLQGFPDNFTRIPYRKKPAENCPDGPRYKALGNSMAVNCLEWIGRRIQLVEEI